MSFLLQIHDAVLGCADEKLRAELRAAAENVATGLSDLQRNPTTGTMAALNGSWARAVYLLGLVKGTGDNSTGGALKEGAELQRRAA